MIFCILSFFIFLYSCEFFVTEEESKRLQVELGSASSAFNQVGFAYNNPAAGHQAYTTGVPAQAVQEAPADQPQGYTPHADDDTFIPPATLSLPPGLIVVCTVCY